MPLPAVAQQAACRGMVSGVVNDANRKRASLHSQPCSLAEACHTGCLHQHASTRSAGGQACERVGLPSWLPGGGQGRLAC